MRFLHHRFQPRGVRCPHLTQDLRYTIAITLLELGLCSPLLADTTWVAGEVYGTWTREGNPYLVTDTLIVPLDSTLNIQPGVQVWFLNQEIRRTPVRVYGRLRAIGAEGDSIYFYSPQAGFGGIDNQETHGTEIRLEYCVIDSIGEDIQSHSGHSVLKHSRIQGNIGISLYSEADTVAFCSLSENGVNMSYGGPSVFQHNRGGGIVAYRQQMEPIFNNQILGMGLDECSWTEVFDNAMWGCVLSSTDGYWHNNQIKCEFYAVTCNLVAERNQIGEMGNITYNRAAILDCQGVFRENRIYGYILCMGGGNLSFSKNLIISAIEGISIVGDADYVIQGNTIEFEDFGLYVHAGSAQIIDNIFMGSGFDCYGVHVSPSTTHNISYNDFFQVTTPTYECELDTGNIWLDPELRGGDPFDYNLQANSPCIDAGDPTSPLDPDGTRADMGAYYYDQLIDHPPALCSPLESTVQAGTEFRYGARATDDYGPLQFGFWDLPPWLQIESLDWVSDSAVVSGIVPLDQEDFTFGAWVEDGLSQRDSQASSVRISQYTVLSGVVTGVLTAGESPYLVADNIIVPAGDSLRIEPGVDLRFRQEELYWEPNMVVRGTLNAVGTSQDSIRFLPEFEHSTNIGWGGIWFRGYSADTSRIEYARFLAPHYAIEADSEASVVVKHVSFDAHRGVRVINNSWAGVDSCSFRTEISAVYVSDAVVDVNGCYSVPSDSAQSVVHVYFFSNSQGSVENCTFLNGRSCSFDFSSRVDFIHNKIMNLSLGIVISNGASGIVANNIFSNGQGLILGASDSVLVANNTFFKIPRGITLSGTTNDTYIKNNIFLGDSVGIEALYGPGMPGVFANISYNDFYDNQIDYEYCAPDTTNIFLNPMVQDTIDFRLSLGSPCIDAGDPDPFFNDVDSTRNDIGCWGGPWGESYPYSPVLLHQPKPIPTEFALLPPYPNPFNSVLVISFNLPVEKEVRIGIYNILGQKVQEYTFPPLSPGVHRVVWNSGSCASGLYIIQLITGNKQFKQKALLIK